MNATQSDCDVTITGAGPVGLILACALADAGFTVTVVEREPRAALAQPAPDGREIALTHRAAAILATLGLWQRFPDDAIAPIRRACVLDGDAPGGLVFDPLMAGRTGLGFLVPNHVIREAAFAAMASRPVVRLVDAAAVAGIRNLGDCTVLTLASGETVRCRLLVAADGRHSETRRRLGIGADVRDFGRSAIVCRMTHEAPSDGVAYECFGYGRTLAILPLNGRLVSAVVTVPGNRAADLLRLPASDYAAEVSKQFGARLGAMRVVGERHAYPLVAVYADRFVAPRGALAGDAAVGMHPVTAHGFNLGLYGIETLARTLASARRAGCDMGTHATLSRYDVEHRRATRPLYLATNALVGLFTDDRLPARALRTAVLRAAGRMTPLRAAITQRLTEAAP